MYVLIKVCYVMCIHAIHTLGYVRTIAGGSLGSFDGMGTYASFSSPDYLFMDTSSSTLYVAETNKNRIRKLSGKRNV